MTTRTRFFSLAFPLLALALPVTTTLPATATGPAAQLMTVSANDGKAAQGMIDALGRDALAAIANTSLSEDAKKQTFKRLLTQHFDMGTIGRFALGRFWRVATPAQQQEYARLYEKMIIDVYTARFGKYAGQTFDVTSNRVDDASGDVVVSSKVISKDGSAPVSVDWRVRNKGGAYRVIDVMVEGVSMAVTQRNDFAGVIQQGGGTIDALLDYLRKGGISDVKK